MGSCVFCQIADGSIPSDIVYEDDQLVVIKDIHPVAPIHVLIVPKTHYTDIVEMVASEKGRAVLSAMTAAFPAIVRAAGLEGRGFRVVNNCGEEGGQTVPHVHFHLIGGKKLPPKLP